MEISVKVHDYGTVHGGINWSDPRRADGRAIEPADLDGPTHERLCDTIVAAVEANPARPAGKSEYRISVKI